MAPDASSPRFCRARADTADDTHQQTPSSMQLLRVPKIGQTLLCK